MIIENKIVCKSCLDTIFSKHRHDFVTCKCGAVSVDGGQEYLRRIGDFKNCIDESWELPESLYKECADSVQAALESNRNKFGIANAVMRALRAHSRVIGDNEAHVIATNVELGEVMISEADGSVNRYKKVS